MDNLQFQNFEQNGKAGRSNPSLQTASDFPSDESLPASGFIGDSSSKSPTDSDKQEKPSFLQMKFYQQCFDIDQEQVYTRILNSFYPRRNMNFITDYIQPNPDLYGPFWISVTLIFAIAIFGNLATFFRNYAAEGSSQSIGDFGWVTTATSLVFVYVVGMPAVIFLFQWYRKCDLQYGYLELLCLYGYSIAIFIPIAALWFAIPFDLFRWSVTAASAVATSAVLALTLWPIVRNDLNRLVSYSFIAAVVILHVLLIICFKEYFFDITLTKATASSPSVQTAHNISISDTSQASLNLTDSTATHHM